ncbi:DUF6624 domain-containing protein [Roseivirga sp.]|uniref:DUF6624 domain-containing protein n=1 Tax=Roseivirga sp. TaxID=1964215 RepID=UPI002B277B2F|nr:DUF6624 domain-containing protein [Roseivirga sp.]
MKTLTTLLLMLLTSTIFFGQANGKKLLEEGNLEGAMNAFGQAFMANPSDTETAYQLTKTLALMNQVDTAFYFLNAALQDDNSLIRLADFNLYSLTTSPKWKAIEDRQIEKFQSAHGQLKNPTYTKALLSIIMKDQSLDYYVDFAKVEFSEKGHIPHWFYPITFLKNEFITNQNFEEMKSLIKKYGWPTYSMVGELASDAPLLVINHHPDDQVRKDYLPMIKEACESGEGSCIEYAKIYDRILVNDGLPQFYGMQFEFNADRKLVPAKIENPEYVDQRRKAIGLEPLKDYLKRRINFDFEVAQKEK